MKAFRDVTHVGNERAIRRGRVVPKGDVNLAYIRAPELSPSRNVVIVDTSRLVDENTRASEGCRLYYANSLGILVDDRNNMVVADEFPVVTDVFSVDEDFSQDPGNEYTASSILGYRHVSRHFHLDSAGLAMPGQELDYDSEYIKIVDNRGVEYDNYRIRIVAAYLPGSENSGDLWAYRVFAYVDTDDNENLYLRYNKTELDEDGNLVSRDIAHKEILNPEPFYDYVPEESDVVDPDNRRQKIYSSKPISYKEKVIGKPESNADGYKVYVPKKAVGDPRIYQLFRWRVTCTFKQDVTEDPSKIDRSIKCGVIVTDADLKTQFPSAAPYALHNLEVSMYNVHRTVFKNPKKSNHSSSAKRYRSYWFVNIDRDDLSQYDFLIWAPYRMSMNMSKYAAKLNNFVNNHNGTIFFDTTNKVDVADTLGGLVSRPVNHNGGKPMWGPDPIINGNTNDYIADTKQYQYHNKWHPLWDGDSVFGGWYIRDTDLDIQSLTYAQYYGNNPNWPGVVHSFYTMPRNFYKLFSGKFWYTGEYYPTLIASPYEDNGARIYSTMGTLFTCSAMFRYTDGVMTDWGMTSTRINTGGNWYWNINSAFVEGAMKLLYNAALWSVQNKIIDNSDESSYSTTWEYSTPWKSSWVINAEDGVLTNKEKDENDFYRDPKDVFAGDTEPVWKRRLSNKTVKQLVDDAVKPLLDNPATQNRIRGSYREYKVEVTNPYVNTGSVVVQNDYPSAWTEAYTPRFIVPPELGPHVIKEEIDEFGNKGRVAEYEDATYIKKIYPDRPYGGRITTGYKNSQEYNTPQKTDVIARGTATVTTKITSSTPPVSSTKTSDIELSWWDARVELLSNPGTPITPGGAFYVRKEFPDFNMVHPRGLQLWQMSNYYSNAWGPGNLCWPHWGMTDKLVRGSTGLLVKFVQEALNRFQKAKFFSTTVGILRIDGSFGSTTSKAVLDLQNTLRARYRDGVVDAETWYLIASQINRLETLGQLGRVSRSDHTQFFRLADRIRLDRISDGQATFWSKRSWIKGGPSIIWELFSITFDKSYKWHGISITPHLEGSTKNMLVQSVHVTNQRSLHNYDSDWGQLTYMYKRPSHNQKLFVPFGPYSGNTIIVGVGQDRSSGWGSAREIGVRDIVGHTRVTTTNTTPGTQNVKYQSKTINFTVTRDLVRVPNMEEKTIQMQPPSFAGYDSVSNIRWTSVSFSDDEVLGNITPGGKVTMTTNWTQTFTGDGYREGPKFPNFAYYSMDEEGRLNPIRENGYVSKAEGIKLLCNSKGLPVGFPTLPTGSGMYELQFHYSELIINPDLLHPSVTMGFYDFKEKEFIGTNGFRNLSYAEYVKRGPWYVYVAVISDSEATVEEEIPQDDDAPRLPYKWAMPVYGVCTRGGARITLESLPENLGSKDVWPIAVREGKFTREVEIRSRSEGELTGWINKYHSARVEAFYALPEAELGGYSTEFGPPNSDIVDEEPIILDDNVIQVRQAPILQVTYPTAFPNPADPRRPVITLYKREDRLSPWVQQPMTEIKDYNTSTGEIYLRHNLVSNDEGLLRVDYTSKRRSYYFKRHEDQILNLNSYSGHTQNFIGDAIYVYIVPHYVKNSRGEIIPESVNDRTLRMTLTPSVFDPNDPAYDPLAVQLGVVYQSTALDVREVAVLDSRKRGGGLSESVNMQEVHRLIKDSATYWDTGYAAGSSYQKSGLVIIRLPKELKNEFSEQEVQEVIRRNITSGVTYKLEDLSGAEWS